MKFPVWTELVCRMCSRAGVGSYVFGTIKRRALKRSAVNTGWKFKHNEAFCSEGCLRRFEKEEI
jgi:hypothetical protein